MSYVRRRRVARRGEPPKRNKSMAGRLVISLILVGAIVYLATATAAGTWIAQNIIAPIFDAIKGESAPGETPAGEGDVNLSVDTPGESAPATDAAQGKTSSQISVKGLTAYALQLGAFSTEQNAQVAASEAKALGAGGYVIADGERHRVIASVYDSEENIKTVRTQLSDDGVESTVYMIEADTVGFKVTASDSQINAISAGFDALYNARGELGNLAYDFDKSALSVDEGRARVKTVLDALREANAALGEQVKDSNNSIIAKLAGCYTTFDAALEGLYNNASKTTLDFSAELKYTHIQITCQYQGLLQSVALE